MPTITKEEKKALKEKEKEEKRVAKEAVEEEKKLLKEEEKDKKLQEKIATDSKPTKLKKVKGPEAPPIEPIASFGPDNVPVMKIEPLSMKLYLIDGSTTVLEFSEFAKLYPDIAKKLLVE